MNPLIISKKVKGRETTIILKRTNTQKGNTITKLGHVFKRMHSGFVLKGEPGLGATTLELNAKRNSIIVEPIKITASSKAIHYSESTTHKNGMALYVGSATQYHPRKLTEEQISKYVNDKSIQFKKIIVVADSLYRIEKLLAKRLFDEYFFMIDEIDSFQLDSSFRISMENCIDIYKQFRKNKRAMVSATSLDFSDPILAEEKVTKILYDAPTTRVIDIYFEQSKVKNSAAKIIKNTISKIKKDEKIMVAYNSVTGCYDIAKALIKSNIIQEKDITILCSRNSKEKIKDFYSELTSTELPTKLNFVTSAYFTGFDLSERYHLISISSIVNKIYSLSDKRFKQIAGRCRHPNGLFTETILYDILPKKAKKENYSVEDIIAAAKYEIAALNCIENNYKHHSLLKESIYKIKNLIVQNTTSFGHQYVRMKGNEPVISYFNIDAFLETLRVRKELYTLKENLPDKLRKEGHLVSLRKLRGQFEVEANSIDKQSRKEQIDQLMDLLRSSSVSDLSYLLEKKGHLISSLQKGIILKYIDLSNFVENERLISLIKQAGDTRDGRKLNNLFTSAYFYTMDPSIHYKRIVKYHFPLGSSFTGIELLHKWNAILREEGLSTRRIDTSTKAIRITKLHFNTRKSRGSKTKHKIIDDNPLKLTLSNYRNFKQTEIEKFETLTFEEIDYMMDTFGRVDLKDQTPLHNS